MRSTIVLSFVWIFLGLASGQESPNAWMKIPSSPARDSLSTLTRRQRDSFWDSRPETAPEVLTPESASRAGESDGDGGANYPEIPDFPNRAVLMATFQSYHSILTASGRTIYTDVIFRVSHIFQDPGHAATNAGITVSLPGGTVVGTLGKISYLTQPRSLFLQPARTYLLLLSYHADGDFYTHVGNWDLSDGIARPNTAGLQARAKEETSISGLTTDALIHTLTQRLSSRR